MEKKILKEGFFKGNYLRGPEIALFSSVPQIAIKYGIRLIIWGESPGYIWNNKKVQRKLEYDGNSLKYSNTISGCDLSWSRNFLNSKRKLYPYIYPSTREFNKNKIQIVFLEYFSDNWSVINNAKISCSNGLKIREDKVNNTGDLYGVMALDDDWVTLNQMIKFYKYGFGRVSDYLNYEIRNGKIQRNEAIKIIEKYDGKCSSKYIRSFCEYIDISEHQFWHNVDRFVNKKLFNKSKNGKYIKNLKLVLEFKLNIKILNYGIGNLGSIVKLLNSFDNINVEIAYDKNDLKSSDLLILPGVGTFPSAIKNLQKKKLFTFFKKKYQRWFTSFRYMSRYAHIVQRF